MDALNIDIPPELVELIDKMVGLSTLATMKMFHDIPDDKDQDYINKAISIFKSFESEGKIRELFLKAKDEEFTIVSSLIGTLLEPTAPETINFVLQLPMIIREEDVAKKFGEHISREEYYGRIVNTIRKLSEATVKGDPKEPDPKMVRDKVNSFSQFEKFIAYAYIGYLNAKSASVIFMDMLASGGGVK